MNNLEEDVNILSRLLEEDSDGIRIKLRKYASEDQHMRMQLMLRDYFKEERELMKPDIEQEARSIGLIFPDIPIEIIQDMLVETGDQTDRSRIVMKKLCTKRTVPKKSNFIDLTKEIPRKVDDNKNEIINVCDRDKFNDVRLCNKIEGKIHSESGSHLSNVEAQPSTSSFVDPLAYVSHVPTFDGNLFERALEVFPDACPKYLQSLCERRDFTNLSLAEVVQSLLEGDYPKRISLNSV